ncbi:MAG: hypothetical protein FWF69_00465 [Firmicutes bacterium]|nr:hypothetical protein [Bacillota bacterium]
MYPFGSRERGISLKTRDILIITICALLLLNVLQLILIRSSGTRDAELRSALVAFVRADVDHANAIAAQLSRTGGTNTQRYLAETRQYLYGLTQLNSLTSVLFGRGQTPLPQSMVDKAMNAVDACEARRQEGLALDAPLFDLGQYLKELSNAAAAL